MGMEQRDELSQASLVKLVLLHVAADVVKELANPRVIRTQGIAVLRCDQLIVREQQLFLGRHVIAERRIERVPVAGERMRIGGELLQEIRTRGLELVVAVDEACRKAAVGRRRSWSHVGG